MDIAAALEVVQPAHHWGMHTEDVINLYRYLEKHGDLPKNPFTRWQCMRDLRKHPQQRYYVMWPSSLNIPRTQNLLDESLSLVHMQP